MEGLRLGAPLAQTGRVMGMRNPQGPPIDPPGSLMCRCVALACLLALARSPAILVKWDGDLNLNADLSRASHARASLCGCSGTLERCAAAPAARSGRHSLRVLPPWHRSTLEVMMRILERIFGRPVFAYHIFNREPLIGVMGNFIHFWREAPLRYGNRERCSCECCVGEHGGR